MTYDEAKEYLNNRGWLKEDGDISDTGAYVYWTSYDPDRIVLDGHFDRKELKALAVYTCL